LHRELVFRYWSAKQPLIFAATGSHALYARPRTHDHTIPNLNLPSPFLLVDYTDAGPLYDPLLTSYTYFYTPSPSSDSAAIGTFTPYEPASPTSFLTFRGRWGDAEYPADDPRQKGKDLLGFKKYTGGPTGVGDKQCTWRQCCEKCSTDFVLVVRKEVWPETSSSSGQRIRTSVDGSSWWKDLWERVKAKVKGKSKNKMKKVDVSGREVKWGDVHRISIINNAVPTQKGYRVHTTTVYTSQTDSIS
jgi:hypothetical protein